MGNGVSITGHSPIIIATENTVFAMPETAIGFFPVGGASYLLNNIGGREDPSLGLYLGLTGHRLKAEELVQWGIATHFVTSDKLDALRNDIVHNVTDSSSNEEITEIVDFYHDGNAGHGPIKDLDEI